MTRQDNVNNKSFILALDQGTTSSRAILFDRQGLITGCSQLEFKQIYPRPGWVEHDPMEIWQSQLKAARQVLRETGAQPDQLAAIGVTSQRETTLVWDKRTGKPVCNAIVWQCRRTAPNCDDLKAKGWAAKIQRKTGLVIDAYFSATKLQWILDNVAGAREKAQRGDLLFGNVDTWLIWNFTGGRVHATDYTNASRTMLYDIRQLEWDEEILAALGIPSSMLPEVKPSSGLYGQTEPDIFAGVPVPITGNAGDQQAALFGQACFEPGMAKNTYGTGCFILMNTGEHPVESGKGLLATIAWGIENRIEYALEGSIFIAGAALQWLRDELRLIDDVAETEQAALQVADSNGVYLVPAFTGLGAPYWDMYARGIIVGLTRGVRREHLIRAALEAIAYQSKDVIIAMEEESGIKLKNLKVDGGAAANSFLLQFQADILRVPVRKPRILETTALGAACLAGLAVGFWADQEEIKSKCQPAMDFICRMPENESRVLYQGWQKAVRKSMGWAAENR